MMLIKYRALLVQLDFVLNVKCKFNVEHRECLRDHPSQRLKIKCLTIIQIELEF